MEILVTKDGWCGESVTAACAQCGKSHLRKLIRHFIINGLRPFTELPICEACAKKKGAR